MSASAANIPPPSRPAPTPEERATVDYWAVAAGMERAVAETRKFVEERDRLSGEREKLAAEREKLTAERDKLLAEARKLDRDRFIAPFLLGVAAVGAAIAAAPVLARLFGIGWPP